jgi:hypothetical protein
MISWVNLLIVLLLHNLSRKKQKEKKILKSDCRKQEL